MYVDGMPAKVWRLRDTDLMPDEEVVPWAPLVDVRDLCIRELFTADDTSALALSVRRLVKSLDEPDGAISAFQSFIS
jgi:uncharacterized protein with HEPN domain